MHESLDEHLLEHILAGNEELAHHNRRHFDLLHIRVFNLMSAPGAGKTSLLKATLEKMPAALVSRVIEGDMVGELDAERLRCLGTKVYQICTGRSCHLDAQMIAKLLHTESFDGTDYLFIENVGNLVCPAEFPLGEHKRIVLLSVTEGDDKPVKYPVIFRNCDAVVFTKADLLPYVDFDLKKAQDNVRALNSNAELFVVSTVSGQGLACWLKWVYPSQNSSHLEGVSDVPVGAS